MRPLIFVLLGIFLLPAKAEVHILYALRDSFPVASPWVIATLGTFLILLLGAVVAWEIFKADRKIQEKVELSWQNFNDNAKRVGLTENEIKLIRKIIVAGEDSRADTIFEIPSVYEKSVEAYIQEVQAQKKGSLVPWDELKTLRKKLGFHQTSPEQWLTGTRQMSHQAKISLISAKDNKYSAKVTEVSEMNWVVQLLDSGVSGLKSGDHLTFSFIRNGDAEYTGKVQVLSLDSDSLILGHTLELERKQLRNWVRVEVNLPCQVILLTELNLKLSQASLQMPKGTALSGRITDISGGGVCMRMDQLLPAGSLVKVSFDLPQSSVRQVTTEIISSSVGNTAEKTHYILRAKFKDIDNTVQEKIVRFVFEKNRLDNQFR